MPRAAGEPRPRCGGCVRVWARVWARCACRACRLALCLVTDSARGRRRRVCVSLVCHVRVCARVDGRVHSSASGLRVLTLVDVVRCVGVGDVRVRRRESASTVEPSGETTRPRRATSPRRPPRRACRAPDGNGGHRNSYAAHGPRRGNTTPATGNGRERTDPRISAFTLFPFRGAPARAPGMAPGRGSATGNGTRNRTNPRGRRIAIGDGGSRPRPGPPRARGTATAD